MVKDKNGNTTKSDETTLAVLGEKISQILEKVNNLETCLQIMENKLTTVIDENKALKQKNHELEKKVCEVEKSNQNLEQRSRIINVEISDVPVVKGEDITEIIMKIGRTLGIQHPENDFQLGHRVPTKNPKKIKPIIVRMTDTKARDKWIKLSKEKQVTTQQIGINAPTRKIYIQCHLTPHFKNILHKTKEWSKDHQYKFVWVRDCQIFLKRDGEASSKTFRIKDLDDLQMVGRQKKD
uniref:Uncharacterized protein n=1 Tax=Cacopsylla melanoneura TaxID=428564 RepID=A0A8D9BAT8_9HEMI